MISIHFPHCHRITYFPWDLSCAIGLIFLNQKWLHNDCIICNLFSLSIRSINYISSNRKCQDSAIQASHSLKPRHSKAKKEKPIPRNTKTIETISTEWDRIWLTSTWKGEWKYIDRVRQLPATYGIYINLGRLRMFHLLCTYWSAKFRSLGKLSRAQSDLWDRQWNFPTRLHGNMFWGGDNLFRYSENSKIVNFS